MKRIPINRLEDVDIDDEGLLVLSLIQKEALLQEQFRRDHVRAVKKVVLELERCKKLLSKGVGKQDRERLKKAITELEEEQFSLLRNEILNACTEGGQMTKRGMQGGLLNEDKLRKVPGSQVYFREQERVRRKNGHNRKQNSK